MPATVKDVAEYCGLSLATVTHILGSRGERYSPKTRERVLKAAQTLGYRKNTAAQAMSTGRFGAVALLQGTIKQYSILEHTLLRGLYEAASKHSMRLTFTEVDNKDLEAKQLPDILEHHCVDGFLINITSHIPASLIEQIKRYKVPSIWLNNKRKHDSVYPDDYGASKLAVEKLYELGHRRIAYANFWRPVPLQETVNHYSFYDREKGFSDAMQARGLEPLWFTRREPGRDREKETMAIFKRKDRPTAVISYTVGHVGLVMHYARLAGLRCPQDLSILTYADETPLCFECLTGAVLIPNREIAHQALNMLEAKMKRPNLALSSRAVPFDFDAGETAAECSDG